MAAEVQMVTPGRSIEQRFEALGRANEIRAFRKELKKEIKMHRRSVREVLAAPAAEVETMKVFDLLLAAPKVGRVKATRMLREVAVSPSKTVGGLSPRQREALLALVGGGGRG